MTRTVGWLTSIYPVTLRLPEAAGAGELLRAVKEQLRRVPRGGVGYGARRYLDPDPAGRQELTLATEEHVLFNYFGRAGGTAEPDAFELAGPIELSRAADAGQAFLIEVNAAVHGERLEVDWSYPRAVCDRQTVAALAARFIHHIEALMASCAEGAAEVVSASDFPLANLDQAGLGKLASLLARGDEST